MLSRKTMDKYRIEMSRLIHLQPIIYENGLFEIYDVPESNLNRTLNILRRTNFIKEVNIGSSKYNFNQFKFNKGFAEPNKAYILRGVLKTDNILEDVEINDTLNPKIWNKDNELLPEVKTKIEEITNTFISQLEDDTIKLNIVDIYILGSNANYNYNDDSDLDIHLIADESFDCTENHLPLLYNAYKKIFNDRYDITINGINTEIYVENKDAITNVSTGVYSLKEGWIKKPEKVNIPTIDNDKIAKEVQNWKNRYLKLLKNISIISIEEVDKYIDDIYKLRIESIQSEGEFGIGNLVFKEIRRLGFIDDLRDLKDELTSKELSL